MECRSHNLRPGHGALVSLVLPAEERQVSRQRWRQARARHQAAEGHRPPHDYDDAGHQQDDVQRHQSRDVLHVPPGPHEARRGRPPYNDQLTREETMMPIAAVVALNTGTMAPTADQLINNAVNAIGGAMNLSRASGRVMKGSVTNLPHLDEVHTERAVTSVTPFDIYIKANNRMTAQHNINGDAITTYAGASGWTRAANADAPAMRADVREANRLEQAVLNPADFKAFLTNLRVTGRRKVGKPPTG